MLTLIKFKDKWLSRNETGVVCFVVNNKCIAATNGFKLCSLISVNTHMRSKSDGCPQRSLCLMHNQLMIVSFMIVQL